MRPVKTEWSKQGLHLFQGLRKDNSLTVKHENLRVVGFSFEKNNVTRRYVRFAN